jgi:hypothetical protein
MFGSCVARLEKPPSHFATTKMDDSSSSSHNRNPTGKNQHTNCRELFHWWFKHFSDSRNTAAPDDEKVNDYLRKLHGRGIISKETIRQLLLKELGVTMR